MGIVQGSKIKDASSLPARKHRSLSKHRRKEPVSHKPTKSRHFPPPPPPPPAAPLAGEVKIIMQRDAWENRLLLDGREAGRMIANVARDLSGRSRGACYGRYHQTLQFRSQSLDSQQLAVLTYSVTRSQHWMKEWEDWEVKVIIERRNAGETWEEFSKLSPPRSQFAVQARWLDHLMFPLQHPGLKKLPTFRKTQRARVAARMRKAIDIPTV